MYIYLNYLKYFSINIYFVFLTNFFLGLRSSDDDLDSLELSELLSDSLDDDSAFLTGFGFFLGFFDSLELSDSIFLVLDLSFLTGFKSFSDLEELSFDSDSLDDSCFFSLCRFNFLFWFFFFRITRIT